MSSSMSVDVAIVGGGLAGTLTALALARRGCDVTLIDMQSEPQPEFRAEQLVGPLIDSLDGLGALSSMTEGRSFAPVTLDTRLGRVVGRTRVPQLGLAYHKMVSGARKALPPGVDTLFGRVGQIAWDGERHRVTLADGRQIAARLLVLATGLATVLTKRLGFSYRTVRRDHSVTIGFDVAQAPGRRLAPPFVQHPASTRDRIDYLAIFPMDGLLRANLFSYQAIGSPWVREFCRAPQAALEACMPGLHKILGPYSVIAPVQTRSNDLRVLESPVRDGVVVVGDAFQTPCPAVGVGIPRLVSDVSALARYAPDWLSSPGMGRTKIAQYYADPEKVALDAEVLRYAEYRRALSTEQTLWWAMNRANVALRRRVKRVLAVLSDGGSVRHAMQGSAVQPS